MSDLIGLMAPIGSSARAEFERRNIEPGGLRDLIQSISGPLTYLPGMGSIPAEVANRAATEGGLMAGVGSLWNDLLPLLMKKGPAKMSAVAVPEHLAEKGSELLKLPRSGQRVALLNSKHEKLNEKALPQKMLQTVSRPLGEILQFPELYERLPGMADTQVQLKYHDPAGQWGGNFQPSTGNISVDYKKIQGPTGLMGILDHEMTHKVANNTGLPRGSNDAAPLDMIESLKYARENYPKSWTDQQSHALRTLNHLENASKAAGETPGWGGYLFNEGEVLSRWPQFKRGLKSEGGFLDVPDHLVLSDMGPEFWKMEDMQKILATPPEEIAKIIRALELRASAVNKIKDADILKLQSR